MDDRSRASFEWPRRIAVATLLGGSVVAACSSELPRSHDESRKVPSSEQRTDTDRAPASTTTATPPSPPARPGDAGESEPGKSTFFELYDPDRIPLFELTLDDDAVATLSDANAVAAKTWVHAELRYGDVTFADVGVRIKGTSTRRLLPAKASLKIKLNKWVKGQKLGGIKELTLNNMVSDPTFLAERITYYVFRSLGLPAPHANTARLSINGEDYGIFANIETPDDKFLARAFGGKASTLYEVNWGGGPWLPGEDDGFEIDIAAPGAAPGTKPDLDLLFQAVAAAKDETLLDDLAGRLHTKHWLRYSAAEALTGHYDGYAYGLWGSHNFFMTGDVDGKFSLVPWSTDLSLSNRLGVPDAANPDSTTVLARCRKSACWDAFKAEVRSALDVYESLGLVQLAKKYNQQIDALVRADSKREESLGSYESETEKLYEFLATRPDVVRAQLGL